jgi:UDP-glucose 4-epimerase
LGTGTGTSVLEMIALFEEVIGKSLSHVIWPRRSGDAMSVYANPAKAERLLWWKARKTVKEAIADGWNFICKHR